MLFRQMTKLTPRQRRHHKTKATILEAAREIIAEKGADGLSLRELARRIDYSPSGLYEYFKSKDDLIMAIRAEGLGLLQDYLNRVPTGLSPSERLLKMGLAYLDFAQNQPQYFMLIFNNLPANGTLLNEPVAPGSPYQILFQQVRAAIEAGEFSPHEGYTLEEITYSLWSLIHGMAMLRQTHWRYQADFDATQRRALQIFAEGLKAQKLFTP
jgi:AcrR family transcriptional regulator